MKNKIILFLIGLLGFSSFLSYYMVRLLHSSALVEIWAIPLLFYYRKKLTISFRDFSILLYIILMFTLIGLLNPIYEIKDVLPIARCFLLGGAAFVICKNNNIFRGVDQLYAFSFGVFIGDMLNAYLVLKNVLVIDPSRQYAIDINILFSVLWVVLTIIYKNWKYIILAITFVAILSFISISRGVMTFFVIGIILAFIIKIYLKPSKIVIVVAICCSAFVAISSVYLSNEERVKKFSPAMYHRLYTKMDSFGDNEADNNRLRPYKWAIDNIDYYVLPRGFLGKKFLKSLDGDNTPLMSPWDSAYMELLYTLGALPLICFMVIYANKLLNMYAILGRKREAFFGAMCVMMTLLFVEYIFTYGLIRSPFMAICNGGFLGFIWRISKRPKSLYGNLIANKKK